MKLKSAVKKFALTLTTLMFAGLVGCHMPDPYAKNWELLQIGSTRQQAMQLLGDAAKVTAFEIPLVSVEQVTWRTVAGRTYLAHFAVNRLVAKSIID